MIFSIRKFCASLSRHFCLIGSPEHLFYTKKENPPKREEFLKKAIKDTEQALQDAYQGLSVSEDPDLIDRYIYEVNAALLRYKVLLREMKSCDALLKEPATPQFQPLRAEVVPEFPCLTMTAPSPSFASASISSTNRETDTSLLKRSFR